MELDLQSLFGLLCTAVLILAETPQLPPLPPPPPFGLIYEGAIGLPHRRHLYVSLWLRRRKGAGPE
jgi:hypothetical protein